VLKRVFSFENRALTLKKLCIFGLEALSRQAALAIWYKQLLYHWIQ